MARKIMAHKIKETDYVFAVAYTHTLEKRMLVRDDYETLLNETSTVQAMRFLVDKGYGRSGYNQNLDLESLLKDELTEAFNEVASVCPEGAPLDIVAYRNDFFNLKTILKAVFSELDYKPLVLEPYTLAPEQLYYAITENNFERLPEFIRDAALEAYRVLARNSDGQFAEIVLDKALYIAMSEIAAEVKDTFLLDWVDLNVTLLNLKVALRGAYGGKSSDFLRDAMLPCKGVDIDVLAEAAGESVTEVLNVFTTYGYEAAVAAVDDSLSSFERWCDNELIQTIRFAKHKAFGFEPILGFLIGKQYELQTVRIIISGIRSGVPAEELRNRIRESYV